MKEIHFSDEFPKLALLIKDQACFHDQIKEHYIDHLTVPTVAISLEYTKSNKITAKAAREYLSHILPTLKKNGITTLYVADAQYFKVLTKKPTTEPHYGYVLQCAIDGFTDMDIIYGVNYQALFHNDKLQDKLDLSLKTVNDFFKGTYTGLGEDLIHSAYYPESYEEIKHCLRNLMVYPMLSCDIETYGLKIDEAKIATIGFAWDEHNGVVFDVEDLAIAKLVKEFFEAYPNSLIFHNASFDIKCVIYHWFMKDPLDLVGMLHGLQTMYQNIHDTKLIIYLATNSTAGNTLGLKPNAFEFAGNYAQDDIDDIRKIDRQALKEYNLIDCLSTWYVFKKFYPIMVQDQQEDIYKTLMLPALKNVTHMELSGMPLDMATVERLEQHLDSITDSHRKRLASSHYVKKLEWDIQREDFVAKNKQLKKKFKPMDEFETEFNAGSTIQVARLLHEEIGLPVLDTTPKGNPAVGNDALKALAELLITKYEITDDEIT